MRYTEQHIRSLAATRAEVIARQVAAGRINLAQHAAKIADMNAWLEQQLGFIALEQQADAAAAQTERQAA